MADKREYNLDIILEMDLGLPVKQCRAVPVSLGNGKTDAVLAIHSNCGEVDPFTEMFFFPTDTLKMTLFTLKGEVLWQRDLGRGVVPGLWFCPVFAFDLDGDGIDEIWFVNNPDLDHPLNTKNRTLERVDPMNGLTTGSWPWVTNGKMGWGSLSHVHRNFILGGFVKDDPVLVIAQGTYGHMLLRGVNADMSTRWEHFVDEGDAGARGSHMCCISDMDGDGVNEVLWGERCIEFDKGSELFCADRDSYKGHSDVAIPVLNPQTGKYLLYTCRESDPTAVPRVAAYDAQGNRLWGHLEHGHMDMGWVARIGENGEKIAYAARLGKKTAGHDGFFRDGLEPFT